MNIILVVKQKEIGKCNLTWVNLRAKQKVNPDLLPPPFWSPFIRFWSISDLWISKSLLISATFWESQGGRWTQIWLLSKTLDNLRFTFLFQSQSHPAAYPGPQRCTCETWTLSWWTLEWNSTASPWRMTGPRWPDFHLRFTRESTFSRAISTSHWLNYRLR